MLFYSIKVGTFVSERECERSKKNTRTHRKKKKRINKYEWTTHSGPYINKTIDISTPSPEGVNTYIYQFLSP
uniref:Uncharacterized protein n=1 Tax=Trypanosoma cruzi TaxID=5693 RepID=Q86RL6_TRYCR|nr:unknown [Trypanosoma cruzi]